MTNRKQRVDSASAAVEVMKGSMREVAPPSHVPLDARDWPFWETVVDEFARSEWTEHQLELAAMLARTMANLEAEQRTLRMEGFIAVRANGTSVENPRGRVVQNLAGQVLSLRRSLSLHARARGEARDIGKRSAMAKAIEADNPLNDDLLGMPTAH